MQPQRGRTVLVTGAAGFIGTALARRLRGEGRAVRAIDLPRAIRGKTGCDWLAHDLIEALPAEALDGVELVIHLAALAGVQASWRRPLEYWRANVLATRLLREACERAHIPRVVHVSSSSVYGEGTQHLESALPCPLSPYGESKLEGERAWRGYRAATIVRLSNVYGPGQRADMAYATFIRVGRCGERLELRDRGRQLRTPTYIDDCVEGILAAAERGAGGATYNIAGAEDVQLVEIKRLLEDLLARPLAVVCTAAVPGDPRLATISSARARRELAYVPTVQIREGLSRQLQAARGLRVPAAATA